MTQKHVIEIEINDSGEALVTVNGKKWTSIGYGREFIASHGDVLGVDLDMQRVDIRTKADVSIAHRRYPLAAIESDSADSLWQFFRTAGL